MTMTNTEYVTKLFDINDKIYIDTSALMNPCNLENFIQHAGPLLINRSKKIFVKHAVWLELVRHLESDNYDKQSCALSATVKITNNSELFKIEGPNDTSIDVETAFADPEFIADLTTNKRSYSQLLITNDKKLSYDALRLNDMESIKGHKIMVCYINRLGQLHKSKLEPHEISSFQTTSEPEPQSQTEGQTAEAETLSKGQIADTNFVTSDCQTDTIVNTAVISGIIGITVGIILSPQVRKVLTCLFHL